MLLRNLGNLVCFAAGHLLLAIGGAAVLGQRLDLAGPWPGYAAALFLFTMLAADLGCASGFRRLWPAHGEPQPSIARILMAGVLTPLNSAVATGGLGAIFYWWSKNQNWLDPPVVFAIMCVGGILVWGVSYSLALRRWLPRRSPALERTEPMQTHSGEELR